MEHSDASSVHAHCVFRRGAAWFALPAAVVREVLLRPAIVPVPHTHPMLAGICHIRSEFVPVLSLDTLLADESSLHGESQLLVVTGADGGWGILVDQVAVVATLETSMAPEPGDDVWSTVVIGWATYREQIARVLNPNALYRLAETALQESTYLEDHGVNERELPSARKAEHSNAVCP